jgi:hypothetical protein
MAAGTASTGADRGTDPSRVIARALRPYAERVRLARVVILVAYLAIIAAGYIIGDPPLWFVLGVTALAVIAATRGVIFVLPREVRALLPRLRRVRLRQDRWLRQKVGLDWRSDPALVLSRLAALDPERLTAIDRFEIVTIARLRHEPEIAARFDPPKADDDPPHLRAIRAYAEAFESIESDPVGAIRRIDGIDVSGLDPDQRELWTDSVGLARAYAAAVQGGDVIAALADAWATPRG